MSAIALLPRRPAVAPFAVAAGAAAAAAVVAAADPSEGGFVPCPVRALTGVWCPGCGLTRAAHQLFRGDIVQALSFNALAPLFAAGLAVAWVAWYRVVTGAGVPPRIRDLRPTTYVMFAAVVAAFTIVRNLPGAELLRGG